MIETKRLVLRPVEETDFEDWARCFADPEVNRYLLGRPQERWEAWRSMAMVMGHHQLRGYSFLSVIEKTSDRWVGRVGPWYPEGWPAPEIGWTIAPWAQKKGYAVEAAQACLDYVRDELQWSSVIHVIREGNTPSIRTAMRLGSSFVRNMDDFLGLGPACIYGQTFEGE